MAWAVLGLRYASVGDIARSRECTDKAFSLIDRVSERERLFITAQRHALNNDFESAIGLHEILAREYPRDAIFPGNLARMYVGIGQFEKGLAAPRKAIELGPKIPGGYVQGFHAAIGANRPDEAKAIIERAFAEGLDGSPLHALRLRVAFVSDDTATAAREIAWFETHPDALGVWHQAANAAARGQERRATALRQSAEQLARSAKSDINPRRIEMDRAVTNALFGRCPAAGASPQQSPPIVAALCGDVTRAEKLIEEQAKAGGPMTSAVQWYLRAQVLLAQGRAREAATAFEAILERKAISWGPEYAAAQVGLARAAARAGDTAKARMAYDNFFALWKDADADIPLLIAARSEYAQLQ